MYKIPASTVFIGKNLVFMPECHSTNSFALQLCQETPAPPEGTLIITEDQTAGRGQRGSSWWVEPGKNFTFSIVLKPTFLSLNHQFYLNIFVSLAIHGYLLEKGVSKSRIKWPNDIYLNNKKACGILVENQVAGSRFSTSVIGIGLNMNQQRFEIDAATSLALELGREFSLLDELEPILQALEARYFQLRKGDVDGLQSDYLDAMYWFNEVHTFRSEGKDFEGTICGIDPIGRLKVRVQNEEKLFGVREISYVQ